MDCSDESEPVATTPVQGWVNTATATCTATKRGIKEQRDGNQWRQELKQVSAILIVLMVAGDEFHEILGPSGVERECSSRDSQRQQIAAVLV
jgi:hypothetical protein